MQPYIPDFLLKIIQGLGIRDITHDFVKFIIHQAEVEIHLEQKKISELQKKYRISSLSAMMNKFIKGKDHDFKTDEDFRTWDAAETLIKNRYKEIDQLRRFLSEYSKKHPFRIKSKK